MLRAITILLLGFLLAWLAQIDDTALSPRLQLTTHLAGSAIGIAANHAGGQAFSQAAAATALDSPPCPRCTREGSATAGVFSACFSGCIVDRGPVTAMPPMQADLTIAIASSLAPQAAPSPELPPPKD